MKNMEVMLMKCELCAKVIKSGIGFYESNKLWSTQRTICRITFMAVEDILTSYSLCV